MSLVISIGFPTERYVAATMTRRDEVEWPPHPARLMLGLLATHFRGDAVPQERAALQWLCEQGPPVVILPPSNHCVAELMKGVFVPQNPSEAKDTKHARKERSFPSMRLPAAQPNVLFHWTAAEPDDATRAALASLVGKLVRLGHSSSLVMGELVNEVPDGEWQHFIPQESESLATPEQRLRVPWPGLLTSAEAAFDANGREQELAAAIERRDKAKKPLTKFDASSRGRYDARHVTCGYSSVPADNTNTSPWDNGLCILKRSGGDKLGLLSTWQFTSVLHKTLLDRWSRHPEFGAVPEWISGHQADTANESTAPSRHSHLALLPLAHVDSKHASGNLLGVGFAIPRAAIIGIDKAILRQQWRQLLSCLLENGKLSLTPHDLAWTVELTMDEDESPALALQPSRWNAAATIWQSVTPIILDRHPKPTFRKDPEAWRDSCTKIIRQACQRLGLPEPKEVIPALYSPLEGVPPAPAFVAPAPRPGRPPRFHIHATVDFAEPVAGPLLIGAGRYRGYGLMKPAPI